MSIRAVIARQTPDGGLAGTYLHGGDPAHVVPVLLSAVAGHFGGDAEALAHYLIDDHPAGWSALGGNFAADPGFIEPTRGNVGLSFAQHRLNRCYCHGDRTDPPRPFTAADLQPLWHDWVYVINPDRLDVHATRYLRGWRLGDALIPEGSLTDGYSKTLTIAWDCPPALHHGLFPHML
ncbi:hypothetical protein [Streptomyces sp. NPDC091371]|uniref:hypothetical protein n=1 Tax=Streptomyces sp. NPDC091371 TaxID=3155303 RepID=UPI0034435163